MSSQGPSGKKKVFQGDASNWTESLKRQKTYTGLLNNFSGVKPDLIQSNQLQTDYRLGVPACVVDTGSYPQLRTGQGC